MEEINVSEQIARTVIGGVLCAVIAVGLMTRLDAQNGQPSYQKLTFDGDTALWTMAIRPDKTADFEMVMNRLKEALAKSEKPERRQQAMGYKVYKSPDPAGGNVLYVVLIDPSVLGADYTVANILSEAFPKEANDLYTKFAESLAQGLNIVNLTMMNDFSK